MIDRSAYYDDAQWERFMTAAEGKETPFILVDLGIIRRNYERLAQLFPFAKQYYAVKANPAPEIITLLNRLGSNFDIASRWELDKVLALGVTPDRISYGNTIKKARDVEYFYDQRREMVPPPRRYLKSTKSSSTNIHNTNHRRDHVCI